MKPKMVFEKIWTDDDMAELHITACDGTASFTNRVYVGHTGFRDVTEELHGFKDKIHGGIYDLRFGKFGPEFGSGAFHAHMHFHARGKLLITVKMQSDFFNFGQKKAASEATLLLISEPALLDNFIQALRAVGAGHQTNAELEAVDSPWVL